MNAGISRCGVRLASFPPEEVAVSIVTVEEMLRGAPGHSGPTL
jgi:hypothetical protein